MIYKVGILGASGKMGLEIAALLAAGFLHRKDCLELADAVASTTHMTSIEGVPVRKLDDFPREPVHVWIDFSRPAGTLALLEKLEGPVVIGTTGFSEAELAKVHAYSNRWPVLLAANTSPGMNLMLRMVGESGVPSDLFQAVLRDEHHRHKKDAPSGTAKAILETLRDAGFDDVQVQVTRAGGIVGNHTVTFVSDDEEITITHRVFQRVVFAKGALLGALFLLRHPQPGLYTMQDVFRDQKEVRNGP